MNSATAAMPDARAVRGGNARRRGGPSAQAPVPNGTRSCPRVAALLEVQEASKAAEVDDRIRSAATTIYQALLQAELTAVIGAAPHERTDTRTAQHNGSRPRVLTTTAGDLELRIPKLRAGSFFPSLLERRRRIDQPLFAVLMEACLHGVSTRKVDDLVRAGCRERHQGHVR